jgi:hypothetical protein
LSPAGGRRRRRRSSSSSRRRRMRRRRMRMRKGMEESCLPVCHGCRAGLA